MKDLKNDIAVTNAFNTQVINTDTVTNGNIIDLKDYEGCTFIISAGVVTAGSVLPILKESDVITFGGEETAVSDVDLIGTELLCTLDASHEVKTLGYKGSKRYVRLSLDSDASANLTAGASCVRSHGLVKKDITNLAGG